MRDARPLIHAAMLRAAFVLLTGSACMPPIAFHDGLPAWSPEARGVEWRVGYHRLSAFGADSFNFLGQPFAVPDFSVSYLTPGVRVGLNHRPPLVTEVGLASVITVGGNGFSALFGAEFGLGYTDPRLSVMFRPSAYLLDVYSDSVSGTGVDMGYWSQVSMLVGTGYRARGVSLAASGRASPFGAGPLAVVDVNLRPVEFRAEISYMLPVTDYATGGVLTVGLTAGAPTKPQHDPEQDDEATMRDTSPIPSAHLTREVDWRSRQRWTLNESGRANDSPSLLPSTQSVSRCP
jgi:hypothetical protein